MQHRFISAVLALLLLVLVQTSHTLHMLVFLLAGYAVLLAVYNAWFLRKSGAFSFWTWLKPMLVLGGMVSVLCVLYQWHFGRGVALLGAMAVMFLTELSITLISEQRVFMLSLLTYFCLALGIFDMQFTLALSGAATLALIGIATFLVARASFDYIPQPNNQKNFFASLVALALLEISWVGLFLPVHFSIIALLAFLTFYSLWIVTYYHLFNNLTVKKASFHIIFSALIIILAFFSTPWS